MPSRAVILDTNFLLVPFQFKINIIGELEYLIETNHHYVISSKTIGELKRIAKNIGKDGMAAKLGLKMIDNSKVKIEIIENNLPVDDWILKYTKKTNAIVCTNDTKLRKRLRQQKAKVIAMKSKSRLGFV